MIVVAILMCINPSQHVQAFPLDPVEVVENHYPEFPDWNPNDFDSEGWDGVDLCGALGAEQTYKAEYYQYASDQEISALYDYI